MVNIHWFGWDAISGSSLPLRINANYESISLSLEDILDRKTLDLRHH